MIVQTCQFTLPDAGFITEEGTETQQSEEYNWVIDPLDGTTNFMHGLPFYAVSIALLRKEEPVLGVVYEVSRDECFYAVEGQPAYMNQKEIRVSSVDKFEEGLYITGFPYKQFDDLDEFMKMIKVFLYGTHGLRRLGSAATDLAYVACGRSEGFFENNLNPWDVAAGAFIVKQAGGIVTDYEGGNDYVFGKSIAAGCQTHSEMLKLIQKHLNIKV